MFGLSTIVTRILAGALLIILILGVLQVRSCSLAKQRAAQSKIDRGQAGAARESAKDAIQTQGEVSERGAASEDLTRTNEKEIRGAEGSTDPVNPAARDAGLASLCRRPAYRNHERCKLRVPDPA